MEPFQKLKNFHSEMLNSNIGVPKSRFQWKSSQRAKVVSKNSPSGLKIQFLENIKSKVKEENNEIRLFFQKLFELI